MSCLHVLAAWLGASFIVGPIAARFFAVANPQQPCGSDQEQRLSQMHSQLLGSLSVGGQVNNLDHDHTGRSFQDRNHV